MGKNSGNSWLNAVKKAFGSPSIDDEKRSSRRRDENEPEDEEKKRGKKRWLFRRHLHLETTIQHNVAKCANSSAVRICRGEESLVRKQPKMESSATEQRRVFAVAMATTAAAEAAVATAQAAVEIIRLTRPALLVKEDKAALVIQKIFRGYLARRALMALRGVVKLQALIRGHNVRKRAKMTLQCIQSLVRVQGIVCDQRRRLSREAATLGSMFRHDSLSLDVGSTELEEIHALIQKAKECSLKQGNTLAHALSQVWAKNEDQLSDTNTRQVEDSSTKTACSWMRKDRNLCNQRDPIKTIEVDSMFNMPTCFNGKRLNLTLKSPKTPSSSKTRSIPCSPCYQHEAAEAPSSHRVSMSENSFRLPRPNYMAATASAIARVKPNSTPRQRLQLSPRREVATSAKKRLSFAAHDFEEKSSFQRCKDKPYYGTD